MTPGAGLASLAKWTLKAVFVVVTLGCGIFLLGYDRISTFGIFPNRPAFSEQIWRLLRCRREGRPLPLRQWWQKQRKYKHAAQVPVDAALKEVARRYGNIYFLQYLQRDGHIDILMDDIYDVFGPRAGEVIRAIQRAADEIAAENARALKRRDEIARAVDYGSA